GKTKVHDDEIGRTVLEPAHRLRYRKSESYFVPLGEQKFSSEVELNGVVIRDQDVAHRKADYSLPQEVFELDARVRLRIAVFYDNRSVNTDSPVFAGPAVNGARSRDHYGAFRHDQRSIFRRPVNRVADHIVDRGRAVQNRTSSQHGPCLDHSAFVDAAVPADQD